MPSAASRPSIRGRGGSLVAMAPAARRPACCAGAGTSTVFAGTDPCLTRLAAEGYRQRLVYQPADRFWQLQATETGVCLALAALLATAAVAAIRRPD